MTMTPEQATAFQETFGRLVANVEQVLLGKTFVVRLGFIALLQRGPPAARGLPGHRQDLARARDRPERRRARATASSSPPTCCPVTSPASASTTSAAASSTSTAGRCSPTSCSPTRSTARARRPRPRCSRSWRRGRSPSTARRTRRRAVHGHRDPEPDRAGRHLPAARGAARPLPAEGVDRLPRPRVDPAHPRGRGHARRTSTTVPSIVTADAVLEMAQLARTVHVDPSVNDYVSRLVEATRGATEVRLGVSVRGALALVRTAKTLAAASGRHYVVPDDVKSLAEPVLAHRLVLDPEAEFDGVTPVERHRPAAARDRAAERSASRVSTPRGRRDAARRRRRVEARRGTPTRSRTTGAAGLTNTRTRIVGARTGVLADAVVAVVRVAALRRRGGRPASARGSPPSSRRSAG